MKSNEKETFQARNKKKSNEIEIEGRADADAETGGERRLNRSKASQERADRRIKRMTRSRSDQSDTDRKS